MAAMTGGLTGEVLSRALTGPVLVQMKGVAERTERGEGRKKEGQERDGGTKGEGGREMG